ncbi:general substrate transporter [Zychaea mexicana]|uniref:general substrate transporter n=1 Tax=Zychaea mexicana TaxID=64656 RepID=UPI0022FE2CB7|nr:general substrate transporter [Zychaea mexicana]KAI9488218.1 general substrate transporter [Zychaea mexicana]
MVNQNPHNRSEDLGFPLYMTFCAVIAALSGLNVGWHISVPNMPQQVIIGCTEGTEYFSGLPSCLPMTEFTWGFTVGAFALGGLVGSLATTYLNLWFGRRLNIMISCGWFILGGILSAVSINIGMYSVGRAFVGIGAGMCGSSVAIYVSEISTKKSRGALGSLFELFLNLGILLTQVAGRYMSYPPVWRVLWAIPTIIAAIQLFMLLFLTVECPRRLCADGKADKARDSLRRLRKGADIDNEFQALLDARQREVDSGSKKMSILDIILVKNRTITWNVIIVMVLQASNQIGGIGPMSVYSVGFLSKIFGGDVELATNISLANATANIVATFISVITMHKVGRKGFMMISTLGMTIASVFLVIGSAADDGTQRLAPLSITAAILFTFTYSMGCGVIPWLIAPELIPLVALPPGSALGNASNWLFNFVINTVWPYQDANLGDYSFTVFAAINFLLFLFVVLCMPETTHRDLDQQKHQKSNEIEEAHGSAGSSDGSNNSFSDDTDRKVQKIDHIEDAH